MSIITAEVLKDTISFEEFKQLTQHIISSEERPEKYRDEKMLRYTIANLERINKCVANINIESKLYNALSTLNQKWVWLVLAEPWCGDVAQEIGALYTIAGCSENIDFRILQSDANPHIVDAFATNGSRSIPKLICLNADTLEVIGTWGPRPAELQQMVMDFKANPTGTFGDFVRKLHAWYEADNSRSMQLEFIDLVKEWKG